MLNTFVRVQRFKDVEDDARVLPLLPPMLSQFVAEAQWLLPYLQKLATPNIAAGGGAALLVCC